MATSDTVVHVQNLILQEMGPLCHNIALNVAKIAAVLRTNFHEDKYRQDRKRCPSGKESRRRQPPPTSQSVTQSSVRDIFASDTVGVAGAPLLRDGE